MTDMRSATQLGVCVLLFSLSPCRAQVPSINWVQQAGGSGSIQGQSVGKDGYGNIFVAGNLSGSVTFGTDFLNSSGDDFDQSMLLAKYDQAGNSLWGVAPSTGDSYASALTLDGSGNVYVCGRIYSSSFTIGLWSLTNASGNLFLAKVDENGNFLWAVGAGGTNTSPTGISTDAFGFCYLTGQFTGSATFGGNNLYSEGAYLENMFIAKYSTNGVVVWAKQASLSGGGTSGGIALDTAGNIYVSGGFSGHAAWGNSGATTNLVSKGLSDLFLAKYDNDGRIIWVSSLGITNTSTYGVALAVGSDGNPVLIGSCSSNSAPLPSFLCKYSAAGTELWATSLPPNTSANSIGLGAANSLCVTGSYSGSPAFGATNLANSPNGGLLLAQYDSLGNLQWANGYGGVSGSAYGFALSTGTAGNIYLTGQFSATVPFGSTALTSAADTDLLLLDLTTAGNLQQPSLAIHTYPGLTIGGFAGGLYSIQYEDLLNTNWQTLTNIVLPYSPFVWIDTSPLSASRFYRVRQP